MVKDKKLKGAFSCHPHDIPSYEIKEEKWFICC